MNGASGDTFQSFWDELAAFVALVVGEGVHERRKASTQQVSYVPRVVSLAVLRREVATLLHAKEGHEQDKIPSVERIGLQFLPTRPDAFISAKFTGRFKSSSARCSHVACARNMRMHAGGRCCTGCKRKRLSSCATL